MVWIPSGESPADLATRVNGEINAKDQKMWQNGPNFLQQPFQVWPIKLEIIGHHDELSDYLGQIFHVNKTTSETKDVGIIDVTKFNDYKKLINVTCIIINIAVKRSF